MPAKITSIYCYFPLIAIILLHYKRHIEEIKMGREVLVVASKVKNYIKNQAGFNTSAKAIDGLSDKVRQLCDNAIGNARGSKRKTVMDKDFQ